MFLMNLNGELDLRLAELLLGVKTSLGFYTGTGSSSSADCWSHLPVSKPIHHLLDQGPRFSVPFFTSADKYLPSSSTPLQPNPNWIIFVCLLCKGKHVRALIPHDLMPGFLASTRVCWRQELTITETQRVFSMGAASSYPPPPNQANTQHPVGLGTFKHIVGRAVPDQQPVHFSFY